MIQTQKGIIAFVNNDSQRIWLKIANHLGTDLDPVILNREDDRRAAPYPINEVIKDNIYKVFDMYFFEININKITDEDISASKLKRILKQYIANVLYPSYYGYTLRNGLNSRNADNIITPTMIEIIEKAVKDGIITCYEITKEYNPKTTFNDNKMYGFKEVPFIEEEKTMAKEQLELKSNGKFTNLDVFSVEANNIDKLLEIECAIREIPKEELLSSLISDKAKEILKIATEK